MSSPFGEKESTWADVRTALIVFSYLVIKAEEDRKDLVREVGREIRSHQKKKLEEATDKTLDGLKVELLIPAIMAAVAQSFSDTLQEAKWTKWLLYISQGFGIAGAGALLSTYDKLPTGTTWFLLIYCVGATVGLLMLMIFGRQKIR